MRTSEETLFSLVNDLLVFFFFFKKKRKKTVQKVNPLAYC